MVLRDPISSVSHLLTALWAAYATIILLRITPPLPGRKLAVAVFGFSMVLLYTASGTFHGVPFTQTENPDQFRFFQKLDQSAIYVLIAGTNTPCLAILLSGRRSRLFLGLLWSIVAAGIACQWLLPKPPHVVIVAFCLGMGWLGIVPIFRYYRAVGWKAMNWMWLGAGVYTLGAICELAEWPQFMDTPLVFGFHEVMHICDTAGSMAFFAFVSRHVVGYVPKNEEVANGEEIGQISPMGLIRPISSKQNKSAT